MRPDTDLDSGSHPAERREIVGASPWAYAPNAPWPSLPDGYSWREATAVAVDAADRVYVFNRGDRPVMVFDRDGSLLSSWGEGEFQRAHGVAIGPDGAIFCTDDLDHTIRKYSPDGRLLMTLGTRGQPSDTGATSMDYRTIRHAGPPFHYPTNVAFAPEGEIYVADGYGNACIHKFSPEGQLLLSWGEPGAGPGQFHVPHGIAVDRGGAVYVADRENSRIQVFSPTGRFLHELPEIARPCQVAFDADDRLYVAELGYHAGMWPGTAAPTPDATGGRVSVFDPSGKLLVRWGGGRDPMDPGDFFAPHDIAIDSRGDVYVAEVTFSAGGNRGVVPADCPSLRKFSRVQRSNR